MAPMAGLEPSTRCAQPPCLLSGASMLWTTGMLLARYYYQVGSDEAGFQFSPEFRCTPTPAGRCSLSRLQASLHVPLRPPLRRTKPAASKQGVRSFLTAATVGPDSSVDFLYMADLGGARPSCPPKDFNARAAAPGCLGRVPCRQQP